MSLKLRRHVSKSGRRLIIGIPADVVQALGIDKDSEVLIWIEDTRMIVEKATN